MALLALLSLVVAASPAGTGPFAGPASPLSFSVSYPRDVFGGQFTGRVVVYLSKRADVEPRFGPDWLNPAPLYAADFKAIKPEGAMVINDQNAVAYPAKPSEITPGDYTVQAVIDRNQGARSVGEGDGNLYSAPTRLHLDPNSGPVTLVCDQVIDEPTIHTTDTIKLVEFESPLLSTFNRRSVVMRATVVLPDEYLTDRKRTFPILLDVPGYGGTHVDYPDTGTNHAAYRDGKPFIYVRLNPDCPTGHHQFADSANNGPWGTALVKELLPYLEREYKGDPTKVFVTGHSSGGWSALYLQTTFPSIFAGCWAISPDPVDFRNFQGINLYQDSNVFVDAEGHPRPGSHDGPKVTSTWRQWSDIEQPLRGEQIGSWMANYSPKAKNGRPAALYNPLTGAIDPIVAKAWAKFDIDANLRAKWDILGPELEGKLHVYVGDEDTFYLDGAVKSLQADLKRLGSDADIEVLPGDHSSVLSPMLKQTITRELAKAAYGNRQVGNGGSKLSLVVGKFLKREVTVDGVTRKFQVYVANDLPAHPPVVLFLHGYGESGTDGDKQTTVGLGAAIKNDPDRWPFLVIFPQKPDFDPLWPAYKPMLNAILASVEKEFSPDPTRRYLTGLSQGGNGTLTLAAALDWKFAAIAPICGWADPKAAAQAIGKTPIWIFHGASDPTVPCASSIAVHDWLVNSGAKPKLTIYPGIPHDSWDLAYGEPLGDWFLQFGGPA